MKVKKIGSHLVLIKPAKLEREASPIAMSEIEKENLKKEQNRGTVIQVGKLVEDWAEGDFVSFYRNAATEIKEKGESFLTIHEGHVLVAFEETED
jgi:co-chaperonin GroES (HSP10)